jgi:hypothetical protein
MTVSSVPGLNLGAGQFASQQPYTSPTQQLANVTSQEWSTYMQHFVPYENQLIQYAMDPNKPLENMQLAQQQEQQAQTQATGIQTRQMQQTDTTLTPEQQAAVQRTRGISNAQSVVNVGNQAKDVTVANQMGIAGMPMSGITGAI